MNNSVSCFNDWQDQTIKDWLLDRHESSAYPALLLNRDTRARLGYKMSNAVPVAPHPPHQHRCHHD